MDFDQLPIDLGRPLAAFLLALPIGCDREHRSHSAGLPTFPLVAVASAGDMLMG